MPEQQPPTQTDEQHAIDLNRWHNLDAVPTAGRTYSANQVAAMLEKNRTIDASQRLALTDARTANKDLQHRILELNQQIEDLQVEKDPPRRRRRIRTAKAALKAVAEVTEQILAGEIDPQHAKAAIYALQTCLVAFKMNPAAAATSDSSHGSTRSVAELHATALPDD